MSSENYGNEWNVKTYITDSKGKSINFSHRDVKIKKKLSKSKSKRLFSFVNMFKNKRAEVLEVNQCLGGAGVTFPLQGFKLLLIQYYMLFFLKSQ